MLAELHCRDGRTTLNEFASARGSDRSDRSSDDGSERGSDDSGRSYEEWGDELSPDENGRYLAAANETSAEPSLRTTVHDNKDPALHAAAHTTPYISARGAANCANKCTMLASERNKETQEEVKEEGPDNWILSARQEEKPRRELAKEVQLLSGERLGWRSEQKFDRRVRMRTLVNGAVNNTRTQILLDTGANVSVISEKYARKLRLREILGHGRCMEVQGITKGKTTTTRRASVKITLGWERVYVFELWIMDHNAGVDVVLGTDFMIPAGVRLDLFQANAKLPDEGIIPLIKTMSMLDEPEVPQTEEVPTESMAIPGREWQEFKLRRNKPPTTTHELWIRRTEKLIPSVTSDSGGTIADKEAEDSSVDEDPAGSHGVHEGIVSVTISGPPTAGEVKTAHSGNATSKARGTVHAAVVSEAMTNSEPPGYSPVVPLEVATTIEASSDNSIAVLEQTFVSVVRVLTTEGTDRGDDNSYEHDAAEFELEDYAKELAFLPDMTEPAETKLDYTANNVRNPELSPEQQASLIAEPRSDALVNKSRERPGKIDAAHEDSVSADPVSQLINSPDADMFTTNEADTSTLAPVFDRLSFVDDICFGGKTFDECLATLDKLLSRFEECRISISFTKSIFAQSRVDFLSHDISRDGMRANSKKLTAIAKLPFSKTKKGVQSFLGAINYYGRFIQDFAAYGAALYQLKDDDFKPGGGGDLSIARRSFAALQRKVANAPILRHFDKSKDVHLMLFANEWALSTTILQMHDDKLHPVRFCGRVLKDSELNYHPAEKEVLALLLVLKMCYTQLAGRQLKVYTRFSTLDWIYKSKSLFGRASQLAKNQHQINPSQPESRNFVQIVNGNTSLPRKAFADFVQDEPAAISVMTRYQKKSRRKRVRFADVHPSGSNEDLAEYDRHPDNSSKDNEAIQTTPDNSSEEVQAPADNGTILTSPDNSNEESQTLPTIPNAEDIDPVAVQNERRQRIAKAQEEVLKWANLKAVLRGNSAKLGYKAARDAWKVMDQFVLSEDEVLYYEGTSRRKRNDEQAEIALRLVVPTTMIQEVLQNCHDSLEGGHQGVVRTYQRVKLDYFWIGLYADVEKHVKSCPDCSSSKSRPHLRGHSPGNILAELPFQLVSMTFADNSARELGIVAVPVLFHRILKYSKHFAEMMQSKSRATLSYRPQANGQQERSVKTVIQSVQVYAEDPLQQDWDEIGERLVFAINTSMDKTRRETPFYLVHGWNARSTLRAMTSLLRRGTAKQSDALAWRREVNRQQEIALEMAKEYQATEKARRAKEHNDTLSRQERTTITQTRPSGTPTEPQEQSEDSNDVMRSPKPLFEVGSRAWLYMERVKPGLTKKLAHRWHGPFRIKKKVEEYAYELELPDRSGYRFHPVVHVSRLKPVNEFQSRPTTRLAPDISEHTRLDFDEELLLEDSWEPD
ncbi:unnamed protein product [Phytophthora fragariaefolia]|uniref:Unnamed protein product n=1 Tax=Phytophthora fragariaefolia TaxID=1490495 RepID=A0A9W6X444_9STRA|nr:unnamed protein product [Phytophthora fragariaefolia]